MSCESYETLTKAMRIMEEQHATKKGVYAGEGAG